MTANSSDTTTHDSMRRRSTLMGCDMVHTHATSHSLLDYYTEILSSRIPEHRGVVLTVADTLVLAEFKDAADAVNCAISIQEQFAKYNRLHLDEGSIDAILGLDYGDLFFAEGEYKGKSIGVAKDLLSRTPGGKIYLTSDVYARVRQHLPLRFSLVRDTVPAPTPGGKELFSVDWKAVTENLEASLKRLGDEDLHPSQGIASKLGIAPAKRASPIVMIFILLFIFILFKILKWL